MLHNIRYGFATNSSSTHSIIFRSPDDSISDDYRGNGDFGWDTFTVASPEGKTRYLAAILYSHFQSIIGTELALLLVERLVGVVIDDGYVDHQSIPVIPCQYGRPKSPIPNLDFFEEYKNFIMQETLVILGGNDNGEGPDDEEATHPLTKKYQNFVLPLLYDQCFDHVVGRKDREFGFWTLFDRRLGTKTRFSISTEETNPMFAHAPELVDLKITNYCGTNTACKAFCYQGSNKKGSDADMNYLRTVIHFLSRMEVLEVAIGGGEPTTCKHFEDVLMSCYFAGITPNFTTKNLDWLKDDQRRSKILSYIGSFAYSVTRASEVREFGFLWEMHRNPEVRPQVQLVLETISEYEFANIIRECSYHRLPLTLLGFKETGKGLQYKQRLHEYDWMKIVEEERNKGHYIHLGVDTAIIKKYQNLLTDYGIKELFYTKHEGTFSCYIDAVEQQMGPCSYEPENMVPFTRTEMYDQSGMSDERFLEIFHSYRSRV